MKNQIALFPLMLLIASSLMMSCGPKVYNSGLSHYPSHGRNGENVPPRPAAGPGECWKVVELAAVPDSTLRIYNEFTGTTMPDIGVVKTEVVMKAGSEKWIKKKADRNCLSADPADCLVWCLVKTEPIVETFYEVRDTIAIKDFAKKEIYIVEAPYQYKDWKRVLCDGEINKKLIIETKAALTSRGYTEAESCDNNIKCLLPVLAAFEKKHGLVEGILFYETFVLLGIKE